MGEPQQIKTYSIKLLQASNEKAKVIAINPKIFRQDYPETHVATIGHFSMFYKFNSKEIIITAFLDNRQDPKKLLEGLKKAK